MNRIEIKAERIALARLPTPLEALKRASAMLGAEVWVKRDDLSDTLASGNKIRKLEFSLAEARRQKATTIITCGAVQSNHARATAAMGLKAGFEVRLVLLGDEKDRDRGNHLLDRILGAQIRYIDLEGWRSRSQIMAEEAAAVAAAGGLAYVMPEGGSDVIGTLGYVVAAEEITQQEEQLGFRFDHMVCALGTGGTLAGLAAGFALMNHPIRVHGISVCNDRDYFAAKTRPLYEGLRDAYFKDLNIDQMRFEIVDGYKGRGYGKSDKKLRMSLLELARLEGLILDPVYTMKAWSGMVGLIKNGVIKKNERTLFLHSGGLFGLLGQGHLFRELD